eukprot:2586949-Amphidinium_carterae.1
MTSILSASGDKFTPRISLSALSIAASTSLAPNCKVCSRILGLSTRSNASQASGTRYAYTSTT